MDAIKGITDITGLLSAIYGGAAGSAATSTDPLGDLKRAEANSAKDIARTAKQPQVARDIAAFRAKVAAAKTPAALLKDPTVLKVLLTANGLGSQAQYPALAQKALLSDTTKKTALANTLPNAAWKSAASLYDFANKGLTVLKTPSTIDAIANGYAEVTWRQSLDATTPGLSNALTFRDQASGIKSVDQILGSATLRTVVTTTLGIPQQIAFQTLGAQELAISSRVDITKFKDPKFVEKFVQLYLIQSSSIGADPSTSAAKPSPLSAYGFSTSTDTSVAASDKLAALVVKSSGLLV